MVKSLRQGMAVYSSSRDVMLVAASVTLVKLTARQEVEFGARLARPEVMVSLTTAESESPAPEEIIMKAGRGHHDGQLEGVIMIRWKRCYLLRTRSTGREPD